MSFPFRSILLHKIPDNKGWFIIGVNSQGVQETIAMLIPVVGEELARSWANQVAENLAGKPYADLDNFT